MKAYASHTSSPFFIQDAFTPLIHNIDAFLHSIINAKHHSSSTPQSHLPDDVVAIRDKAVENLVYWAFPATNPWTSAFGSVASHPA